ncbi:MSP domain containing protein, partial [Aphelenchoides avenae]
MASAPPPAAPPAPTAAAPAKTASAALAPANASRTPEMNKPDEPPFQLKLEPDTKIAFKSDKLEEGAHDAEVKLTNNSKQRQTFKVKCTSNELFRVRPPLGFVKPEETVTIKISYSSKSVPVN